MITCIPIQEAAFTDLAYVAENMREMDKKEILATRWTEDLIEVARDLVKLQGLGYLFCYDSVPVAVIGSTPVHPGVASAYMFATDDFPKVAKSVTKLARRVIFPALMSSGCHRVHSLVLAEYTEVRKWLRFLGANTETPLKHYGRNREDFVFMAWDRDKDVLLQQ